MRNPFAQKRPRAAVLGLDGVPCALLRNLAAQGVMPNMAGLIKEGTLAPMTASIPEVSSTSWSTFMTGVNPGRHGIFGFMELDPKTYAWTFPSFLDLKAPALWEIAGNRGLKSIVINVPATYPARPLNGLLVSGFVALDLRKAAYPDRFYRYLEASGYRLDVDAGKAVRDMDGFASDILGTFRKRAEVILDVIRREEWDLFISAVTETDRLHHYLFDAIEAAGHPLHGFAIGFYRELDAFIGSFCAAIGEGTPLLVVSDHGFTTVRREVYLNAFLKEKGYLRFGGPAPRSFEEMDSASTAFVLDPSRVYLHSKGRFARGCVGEGEYEGVRQRLRRDLLSLEVDGERVVSEALLKEEVYSGPSMDKAPDLVLLPVRGFDLKGTPARQEVSGTGPLRGAHTRDDAVFYINRKVPVTAPDIADVAPTVLGLLGVDHPGADGKNLLPP